MKVKKFFLMGLLGLMGSISLASPSMSFVHINGGIGPVPMGYTVSATLNITVPQNSGIQGWEASGNTQVSGTTSTYLGVGVVSQSAGVFNVGANVSATCPYCSGQPISIAPGGFQIDQNGVVTVLNPSNPPCGFNDEGDNCCLGPDRNTPSQVDVICSYPIKKSQK